MTWSTNLTVRTDNGTKEQGRKLFERGDVRELGGDAELAEATVGRAQNSPCVILGRTPRGLKGSCECDDYFCTGEVCKHIWAVVLAAEAAGYLRGKKNNAPQYLVVDDADFVDDESYLDDAEDFADDDLDDPYILLNERANQPPQPPPRKRTRKPPNNWKKTLEGLKSEERHNLYQPAWPANRELLYVIDVPATLNGNQGLILQIAYRDRKKNGDWGKKKSLRVSYSQLASLPDTRDRQILALLAGGRAHYAYYSGSYSYGYSSSYGSYETQYALPEPLPQTLVPLLCATGRCLLGRTPEDEDLPVLTWEDEPWQFWLDVKPEAKGSHYRIEGSLRRGAEQRSLAEAVLLLSSGLVFWPERVAPLEDAGAFDWVLLLRQKGAITVPIKHKDELLKTLLHLPNLPRLDLPEELRFEEVQVRPRPRLRVKAAQHSAPYRSDRLQGELSFDYDGVQVMAHQPERGIYQPENRRLILRDREAEAAARRTLEQLNFKAPYGRPKELELVPRNLPRVVRTLIQENWLVEAEGKLYRAPGAIDIAVTSGIDWFELHGKVDFGDTSASLPQLLAALRRGENIVTLDDGTVGMLPEEWLKKYGLLSSLGTTEGDHLRFRRNQVGLLDALLASQPEARIDEVFEHARDELRSFAGVEPAEAPAGFVGQLRGYQKDGLGWLHFLQRFGFGGCLADDMGLGKTIQVLGLLERRREQRTRGDADRPPPSLIVVPRSLVFNWKEEAARFTPQLRILDNTGIGRQAPGDHFNDYDVVLATYGTLRRDVADLKDFAFDYCILDEAQAIKNASSESAKAARLLRGTNRLALSGTPIENHLGELWSLFEFLNPGMLGSASVFQLTGAGARQPAEETRALLARALRPFLLRRTKEQVAKDLPPRLEQTISCELEAEQRKLYDQLRNHYRDILLHRVESEGINRAKMQILEALLRLRQAACHPGLIDKARTGESSAKLDALLPSLRAVMDEGHKCLVFSQFTSLLAIVRNRLDGEKLPYEYLDGRTRDRKARVDRFQNDPECKLFLISLKAGGLGLNLTAADYVFLLDPWWNPAVEAQAIDRAHRIGQERKVFAYRLIARDTVEEKVLELQKSKRELADAIINADNSLIRNLGREDLELLLS